MKYAAHTPWLHVQLFLPFLDGFLEVGHQDIFHSSVSLRSFSSAFVNSSMTAKAFTKWIHSESRLTRKLNTTFFKYSKLISLCPQKPFTWNIVKNFVLYYGNIPKQEKWWDAEWPTVGIPLFNVDRMGLLVTLVGEWKHLPRIEYTETSSVYNLCLA